METVMSVAPASELIQVIGRTAADDAGGLRMGYPGVTLRFVYAGAAPMVRMHAASADCYINLRINGWDPQIVRLEAGDNLIPLPSGEAPASGWVVSLVRRTETWQGIATFNGLDLPKGCTLLAPPARAERRLLVIGDSITTGHYVEQMPGAGDPTPRTNNAERTWGWQLARGLGAEVSIVAYGGRGLTRTWDGRTDQSTAGQFFERALADDAAPAWDHSRYQPDAVVVMIGQNDFNLGVVPEDVFLPAYAKLLDRIAAVHPAAVVVLAGSPMQGADDPKRAVLYGYLDAVAEAYRGRTGRTIAVVRVSHQPGTALNSHPVAFQQEQIAAEIEPAVRTLTGW